MSCHKKGSRPLNPDRLGILFITKFRTYVLICLDKMVFTRLFNLHSTIQIVTVVILSICYLMNISKSSNFFRFHFLIMSSDIQRCYVLQARDLK